MTRNRMNAAAGKKSVSRLLAVMLALVLCLSVMPISAAADGETTSTSLTYLALGDSITAGYGLDDASTEVFVTLLADEIGATTTVSSGVSGLTAAQLYAALSAGNVTYNAAIMAADVITITIGGNDLMAAFYQIVADTYNDYASTYVSTLLGMSVSITPLDASAVQSIFSGVDYTYTIYGTSVTVTASDLISQLQSIDSTALASNTTFQTAVATCVANINGIASYIKSVNSDATVLIANQYNPYLWLNSYLTEAGLGSFYNFDSVISLFETGVSYYNYMLSAGSTSDYTIVDVYSAFAASCLSDSSYAGKLTNAEVTYAYTTGVAYDFDFHPNAAGHKLIATTFAAALSALEEESSETETEELTETEETTETETELTETEESTETEELTETEETTETETESTETEESTDTEEEGTETEESASSTLTGTSEDGSMYYAITVDSADSSSYIIVEVSDESGSYIYANSNGTCYYVSASGETTDITDYTGELISLSEGETYSVTVDYDGSDVVISFYNEDGEVVLSYTVADTDMDDEITTTLSASDDAVITIDEASVETAETNTEEETDSEDSTDTEDDTNSEEDTDTEEDTDSEDSTDSEDTESAAGSDDTESGDTSGNNATGGSSSTASGTSSSPKTGDASPIIPIAVAIFGCAAVVFVSKKRMA